MGKFSDKVVVVSGAAGALGSKVVKAFLHEDATVCAVDHREGRLAALGLDEGGSGRLEIFENLDLSQAGVVTKLQSEVHQRVGKVDVIVHTVGGFTYGETVDALSTETWQKMLDINVNAFLNLAKALVPDLVEKGQGKVITIGAKAALKGGAKLGAYSASKAALLRLAESMAAELAGKGIQVNCVLPGTIDTPNNRAEMPNADFSKWVSPAKIAETILFLASPESDAITGAAIPVYGQP
ncbi:MAG: SDR family NAD(P)-dependent oxidoreductase [Anaerolineaceae bacterium]|nr:SDR family NAD(P)-dependent oxidoreductase [Anaerolineaceae bacterium]